MRPAIAIFVKTPRLSPVKTRLGATIGDENATAFYHLCLAAVQETVGALDAAPYWAIGEAAGLEDPPWRTLERIPTGDGDLGERQHRVYARLQARHGRVLLIGADAPQITPALLDQAIRALDAHDFVVGPARDGGYYLFGGRAPLGPDVWTDIPWSSAETRDRLLAALPSPPALLPTLTDADHESDLSLIAAEMPRQMSGPQQQLINWIEAHEYSVSLHRQFRPLHSGGSDLQ